MLYYMQPCLYCAHQHHMTPLRTTMASTNINSLRSHRCLCAFPATTEGRTLYCDLDPPRACCRLADESGCAASRQKCRGLLPPLLPSPKSVGQGNTGSKDESGWRGGGGEGRGAPGNIGRVALHFEGNARLRMHVR